MEKRRRKKRHWIRKGCRKTDVTQVLSHVRPSAIEASSANKYIVRHSSLQLYIKYNGISSGWHFKQIQTKGCK
jgi:hypothetical protein